MDALTDINRRDGITAGLGARVRIPVDLITNSV